MQNNPILIIIMFLLSLTGGIITVILGWSQFYDDYLSKTFSIPIWFALLLTLLIIIAAIFFPPSKKPTEPKELKIIEGKEFGIQRINMDGFHFKRCSFNRSELIFSGRNAVSLSNSTFTHVTFTFSNEAATTLDLLTAFYQDEAFRPHVEQTILNIKSGKHPNASPITAI